MKHIYYMVCIGVITVLLAACSNTKSDTEEYIVVDKRVGEANQYETFKEVTDQDKVEKVQAILQEVDWVTAKVEMIRYPDYRFGLKLNESKTEAKAVKYNLWISPKGNKIELVRHDEYVQLDKDKSAQLFEILTGEKLAGQLEEGTSGEVTPSAFVITKNSYGGKEISPAAVFPCIC